MKLILRAAALTAGIFFWANAGVPAAAQTAPADFYRQAEAGWRLYVAQPGDNFLILGRRLGYAPELLAALNNLSAGYCCRGGENLRLPHGLPFDEVWLDDADRSTTADGAGRRLASRGGANGADNRALLSGQKTWAAPVLVKGTVTSAFGSNRSSTGPHHGLDIAVPKGTPILAAHGGTVLEAGWKNDVYGYAVVLEHGNGWQTLYAHCSQVLVKPGQQVRQGERIALVGSTGNSTGPHWHLELHKDGAFLNPADFFTGLLLEV